jgi:hypothetical protein
VLFKIPVTSADGTAESVTVMLDTGRKEQLESIIELIADALHVPRDQLEDVIDNWTPEKFKAHCANLPSAELKPPAMRRRF